MKRKIQLKRTTTFLLYLLSVLPISAQSVHSVYYMEAAPARIKLNPALYPTNSFFSIPVVGSANASVTSNTFGTNDIFDLFQNNDEFYMKDRFRNNLKERNKVNASVNTDIISFGWHRGKGFWSVNAGIRTDINANIDRSLFDYLYDIEKSHHYWTGQTYDMKDAQAHINLYTEIGIGYARQINRKWTLGARLKLLLGMGNANLKINNIHVEGYLPTDGTIDPTKYKDYYAKIVTDATLESSLKGLKLEYSNTDDGEDNYHKYISDIKAGSFGIGGYGTALDFGLTFRPISNIMLSASVLDLGFINWNKGCTKTAVSQSTRTYDYTNYQDFESITSGKDVVNYKMLDLRNEDASKSRYTSLASTIVVGAECAFIKQFSLGILYTNRNTQPNNISEMTFSANFRPNNWFNFTGSYSMIQSLGNSFGVGLKIGPLFLGTDYMFLGNNSKCANAQVGISIPIGKSKNKI